MTRPGDGDTPPAVAAQGVRPQVARLKKRADFLAAAKGRRQHQRSFVLQIRERAAAETGEASSPAPRFGFTVTKKVGNSVIRNRIRRRLREVVRLAEDVAPGPTMIMCWLRASRR